MRKLTKCLTCGGSSLRLLYASTYNGTVAEAHEYFLANRKASAHGEISRCQDCGFVFTSAQFDEMQYDEIYARIHTAARGGSPNREAEEAASRLRFARLKTVIARYADLSCPFLDFGCGSGAFLTEVASPTATGFEVGAPAVRPGPHGSRLLSGCWRDVAGSNELPWSSQHSVMAFDVFEHLPRLEPDVELIRRVLRPNGHMFVTVPNVDSFIARLSGSRWNMLLLEHLWYFSARTLDRFLGERGFTPLANRSVPYDATVRHISKRLEESLKLRLPRLPRHIGEIVIPAPAGVLLAIYRREP
jgi:SAM-dependent methyltransferase